MSRVSGLSLRIFPQFIKDRFGEKGYERWMNALDGDLKDVFSNPLIGLDEWYDFNEFFIKPMRLIANIFYNGNEKVAWDIGRFSADYSLKGVLKVFVRMGSTLFMMKRSSAIIAKYYEPMEMKTVEGRKGYALLLISNFPDYNNLLGYRICGWIERALEISGCSGITIDIVKPFKITEPTVEIKVEWRE